jgi:tmRNA-binding protein
MNTIDVMKQVLDVLQENHHLIEEHERPEYLALYDRQIAALEQAIKQEEQQPVPVKTYSGGKAWPVQTEWVGLTDHEAQWIYDKSRTPSGMMEMVEAKLKEKNSKG